MAWTVNEASTWLDVWNDRNLVKTCEFTTQLCVEQLKCRSGGFMDHQWKVKVKCGHDVELI